MQCRHDGIMEGRTHGLNLLACPVGPGAIREQNRRQLALGVDPQRSSRVTKMSDGAFAEVVARGRWLARCIPSKGASSAGRFGLTRRKQLDRLGLKEFPSGRRLTVPENTRSETQYIQSI